MQDSRKASFRGVVVFDADNTLWDTDAVFRKAQLEMLRVLAHAGLIKEPESELATLRLLDNALATRFEKFEYDFIALSAALGHYYSRRVSIEEAAEGAFQGSAESIGKELTSRSAEAFTRTLEEIPPMFKDAEEVLDVLHDSQLRGSPMALLMFSDGKPDRLERILEAHDLRKKRIFDDVVIGTKSVESFSNLRKLALTHLPNASDSQSTLLMMIGDSLRRDIVPANRAGFVTVYKPASFLGDETVASTDEEPTFRVDSLLEVPSLLNSLGVPERKYEACSSAISH